jgi:Flp pilus assembly protein TadB
MKINYDKYHFTTKEWLVFSGEILCICIIINYLCFRAWWAFVIMAPFVLFFFKWKCQSLIKARRERLKIQFNDALRALQIALGAGYSMENAVSACVKDLRGMYEPNAPIIQEFEYIKKQMFISVPIEVLFMDLGNRSQIEDIQNFASIYAIAKRSGGNLNAILNKTARMIEEKIETGKEINASIAAKRMEQLIMSIVPCGIILYVQLTSPEYMDVLYGNMLGVAVMTVCLSLYAVAFYLGKKMMEIEV